MATATKNRSDARRKKGKERVRFDRSFGARFVAGVDEVGRGCLAGPLVATAVVFDYEQLVGPRAAALAYFDDSKNLTAQQRLELVRSAIGCVASYSIVSVSAPSIDRCGLHKSNLAALSRALKLLRAPIDVALVDGFDVSIPGLRTEQVIKGDATSAAIAAASIIAKVTRDTAMARLDQQLGKRWAFTEHMGYATPLHHDRIREHGVSDHHRMSFASAAYEQ